ncbi:MAG: hypothetical protein WBN48_16435, partial [Thiogranum sp.]
MRASKPSRVIACSEFKSQSPAMLKKVRKATLAVLATPRLAHCSSIQSGLHRLDCELFDEYRAWIVLHENPFLKATETE